MLNTKSEKKKKLSQKTLDFSCDILVMGPEECLNNIKSEGLFYLRSTTDW